MKRILLALIYLGCMIFPAVVCAQSSGPTPPPPPTCSQMIAGQLYTETGTNPYTVYTCSYYNLAWQWVVNPSYGGLVYYPTVPSTCSGALPVFLAGWPNTQEYVCVNGVPSPIGGGSGTVLPSGDATGATDGAAIQSACAATGLVQLTAGTYYVGHSNSTISVTAPCTIDGASVAATTIQNEGTTNWMFTAAFSETDPSNNYLPGLMVTNLSVHQDSSVTPTGGGAFNLSASGDAFNSSMFEHLYIGGDGLFSGFYIGPQMGAVSISDTFIWIAPTGPSAGQGCMEYNNPAPGGDNNLGFLCAVGAGTINYAFGGLTIDQSDTTTFDGIKIWNAPVLFTGAGATHAVRFVNPSVEGGFRSPNGYAFDFGTGTAPNGVQIVGGETAGFLAAFNHLSNVSSLAYCWDDENVSGSPNQICSGWLLPSSQQATGTIAGLDGITGTPSGSGGTVPAGPNFIQVIAVNSAGLPIAVFLESTEVDTSGSTSSIAWSWSSVASATSYQVLCATTMQTENGAGFTTATNSYTQTVACPVSPTNLGQFTLFTSAAGSGHIYNACLSLLTTVANVSAVDPDFLSVSYTFAGTTSPAYNNNIGSPGAINTSTTPTSIPGFSYFGETPAASCGDLFPDSSTAVFIVPSLGDFASTVQWTVTWYQKN